MNLLATARLALTRIWASKTRSFLTMLGVVIGVASLVALTSVAAGATSGINDSLSSLGANTVTITGTTSTSLDQADASALQGLDGVKAVSYSVSGSETGVNGATTAQVTLTGVSSTYSDIAKPDIAVGTFLPTFPGSSEMRSAVLSTVAANSLNVTSADVGQTITLDGLPFTLVGVLNDASGVSRSGAAYISLDSAREVFAQAPYISSITVQAKSATDVDPMLSELNSTLRARYGLTTTDAATFSIVN